MEYKTVCAHLETKLYRLRTQITTAMDQLADVEGDLMMKGKKPTKAQEKRICQARVKINTAFGMYECAVAEFMERRHGESLCEEVKKYAEEADIQLKQVRLLEILDPA
jgi:hypothetical protein